MDALRDRYHFPVDQSAIYYLFDRDPKSNQEVCRIQHYVDTLVDPYDNPNHYKAGQLLLSYPSIESYIISNFIDGSAAIRFSLGSEAKAYIGQHPEIQLNKITEKTLIHAAEEFLKYLANEKIEDWDVDHFGPASAQIFTKQEMQYLSEDGFCLFSMLTLAFLQMGLIEIE